MAGAPTLHFVTPERRSLSGREARFGHNCAVWNRPRRGLAAGTDIA